MLIHSVCNRVNCNERKEITMKQLQAHPVVAFILKTILYFIVLMLLIYMYGYFGIGQAPFIYNEF